MRDGRLDGPLPRGWAVNEYKIICSACRTTAAPKPKPASVRGHTKDASNPLLRGVKHDLGLGPNARQSLEQAGIAYVGELIQETRASLLKMPGMGRVTVREIEERLAARHLSLGMTVLGWPSRTPGIRERHPFETDREYEARIVLAFAD